MAKGEAAGRRECEMTSGLTYSPSAAQFSSSNGSFRPVAARMPIETALDTVRCGVFTDDRRTQLNNGD
jgi:hypothetical protein